MVKLLALDNISKIATGMGKPFEKHVKPFIAPVCAILADQKAPTRAAASNCLTAMATACGGIDPMVPSFAISLENPNPLLRASLLAFLLDWFQENDPRSLDLTSIVKPLISCVEDRNGDVRKNASTLLPLVVSSVGVEFALDQTSNLKPAVKQTIIPIIQAAQLSAPTPPVRASAPSSLPASAATSPPPRPTSSASSNQSSARTNGTTSPVKRAAPSTAAGGLPARRGVMGAMPKPAASTLSALQRPSSRATTSSVDDDAGSSRLRPTGLKRPLSMAPGKPASSRASSAASNVVDRANPPFRTADPAHKAARAKKDSTRWVFHDKAEPYHTELLANQMEPHASPELYSLLFSRDHNASVDFVNGVAMLTSCFQDMSREADKFGMDEEALRQSLVCNLDLILKYAAIRMYDSNTQAISRSIELVESMIDDFSSSPSSSVRHSFDEYELHLLLPTLISKVRALFFTLSLERALLTSLHHCLAPAARRLQISSQDPRPLPRQDALCRGCIQAVPRPCQPGPALQERQGARRDSQGHDDHHQADRHREYAHQGVSFGRHPMSAGRRREDQERSSGRPRVRFSVIMCMRPSRIVFSVDAHSLFLVHREAYKTAGDSIYDYAKVGLKERDAMEARFKHVQGPTPVPDKNPVARVVSNDAIGRAGSPASSRISRLVPPSSPAPRPPPSRLESPEKPSFASPVKTSISPRPSSGSSTPARGIPRFGGAPASRPLSMMQPRQSASSSQPPLQPEEQDSPAVAPTPKVRTGQLFAPLPGRTSSQENGDSSQDAGQAVRSILSSDPSRSVDGLKRVQKLLEMQFELFQGSVDDLVQALVKQIRLVFDTPSHLAEPPWFRLAKHLIQTLNNFCDHAALLKEVEEKDMEELLYELTSRLLQTDDASGGKFRHHCSNQRGQS